MQRVGRQPVVTLDTPRMFLVCIVANETAHIHTHTQRKTGERSHATIGCTECGVPLCAVQSFGEYHSI